MSKVLLSRTKQVTSGSADRTISELLIKWDGFRKTNWVTEIEYPEITLQQTQSLLSIPI